MELSQEDIEFLKSKGIDPSQIVEQPADEKPGIGKTITSTLKAHTGGLLGGGVGTLAGIALAPATGGASLLVPIAGGLIGGYLGQKGQEVVLPDETQLRLQQEAQAAQEAHPNIALGTDIVAGALASGGRPSLSGLLKGGKAALTGDIFNPAVKRIALGAAINPAIDIGVSEASGEGMPSGRQLLADTAGGALFNESSALGRLAHRGPVSRPLPEGEPLVKDMNIPAPVEQPLKMATEEQPIVPEKSKDDITQNTMEQTTVTPSAIERKATTTEQVLGKEQPTEQKNPSGLTNAEKDELRKMEINSQKSTSSKYKVTVQHDNEVPGSGYVQVDEYKDGQNVRSVSPEKLKTEGIDIPSKEELMKLPQGQHDLDTLISKSQLGGESKIIAPPSVVNHIMTGTATTKSVLEGFAQSEGHTYQEIAKHLLKIGDSKGLGVKWEPTKEDRGAYSNYFKKSTGEIVKESIQIPHSDAGDSRVLIEEALHGLTSGKLPVELRLNTGLDLHDAMTKYLQSGDNNAVKDIIRGYQKTAQALGIDQHLFGGDGYKGLSGNPDAVEEALAKSMSEQHRPTFYAMGSLDEFIAHAFRNEQFQNILNEIPYDSQKSVWQHIVDAIKKILGFDIKTGHMLDHVLRTSSDLIAQDRPNPNFEMKNGRMVPKVRLMEGDTVEGRSQARKGKTVDDEYHMGAVGQFTRNVIDRVKDITHPGAKELANAAKLSLNEQDSLVGRWKNAVIEAGKKLTPADKAQINKVKDLELSTKTLQRGLLTTDAQREYYDAAKKAYSDNADYRIVNKEPVLEGGHPRLLKKDPSYWAGMANQKIEQVYRENSNQSEIAKLDKVFDQWNQQSLGMTPKGSALRIADWKKAIQGSLRSSDVSHQDFFNASRKAMGSPLPPEFREVDPVKNDARYFDRQAIDNSHYKFIESNPKAMAALGQTKDAWGKDIPQYPEGAITAHPQVRALLDQFRGDPHGPMADTERSLSSTLSSMFISGPPLETHKLISNQVKAVSFADNPYQLSRAIGHAVTNIKEGYIHAKENGVLKLSANSALDMFNGSLTSAQRLNGLGKSIRDISTLGGLTTKLNAGLLQSYFEYLVPSKLARANAGDVTNQQFIRRLDPTYTVGKVYSTAEQQKLASLASSYVHGTGDIRSMPAWMMADNETSGFFKLAHWSVAQTNNFMHDVWTPAVNGDYGPLVTSVFGSVVGGYIIKEIREELQGKKGSIPSLQEIASSSRGVEGNSGLLMYNAIAAMQYSGFGGLLSQVLKYPFDFVYKNAPQGATFPMDQIVTDLAKTMSNVSSAIANDPNLNWVDLAQAVTTHILSSDMQLSRMALNQGINSGLVTGLPAEKKLLSDKLGQLRRFDMTEGLPYADIDQGTNPLMNVEQQKFKKTSDITEAAQMIPTLINNIITKYSDHPDVMMAKIRALKTNQYSTFPSMESTPMSFFKYINFLNKSVGPEKAQEALMDFMRHKTMNSMKSAMVP